VPGWCAREVEEELPGLRLLSLEVEVARRGSLTGASPGDIQGRLRELSSRYRGATAVGVRREPVPAAYRVFFRHIGLDPDVMRTPIEAAVLERLLRGGFLSGGLLEDVLLIALVDTGVPVWALAADSLEGPLGVRASGEDERLGRSARAPALPAGRLDSLIPHRCSSRQSYLGLRAGMTVGGNFEIGSPRRTRTATRADSTPAVSIWYRWPRTSPSPSWF